MSFVYQTYCEHLLIKYWNKINFKKITTTAFYILVSYICIYKKKYLNYFRVEGSDAYVPLRQEANFF